MPSPLLPLLVLLQGDGAGETSPPPGGGGNFLIPLLIVFAIFWFVLILPERKQRKKREEMLAALSKGERVLTTSGIYATVVQVQDDVVTLQVADGVRMRFARAAIQNILSEEGASEAAPAKAEKP